MYIKFLNFRELLLKSFVILVIIYFGLISLSLIVTGYLFLTLDNYTAKIESLVYKKTGYVLKIKNVETSLNDKYLPELIFTEISLQNAKNPQQKFTINKLDLVLSYDSIWNLEPVFNKLLVDGAPLNLIKEDSGDLTLNGINLKEFNSGNESSSFDFEHWLLIQGEIKLTNLDFSFWDKKNNLSQIALRNINISLENSWLNNHLLDVELLSNDTNGLLEARLQWSGGKFSQWDSWRSGDFFLTNVNKSGAIFDSLNKYLPDVDILQKFNSETVVSAKILNGKIQYIKANFGLNNFNLALNKNSNVINFPKLAGSLNLELVENKVYKLNASDLTISTKSGYLFNKAQITGDYTIDVGGQISLNNTNVQAFNNILRRMNEFKHVNLDGNIDIIKFSWLGNILKPTGYNLYSKFSQVSVASEESSIPSINNISGNIMLNHESGVLNLALKDSLLVYPHIFFVPYKFSKLDTQITWTLDKNNKLVVSLPKTAIITSDFKIITQGSYTHSPNSGAGFIDMTAHLENIKATLVDDYLPKTVGLETLAWLKHGIKTGDVVNANLILKGDLGKFPYEKGGGLFYITADVKNAQLSYIDKWPTIDNIDGQFILKNQSIIIKADSAKISGNNLTNANVEIPDYTAHEVFLNATGKANGSTQNFLNYLQNTSLNETLGKFPEGVVANGSGRVDISLNIPLDKPSEVKVSGKYTFDNNVLKFTDLPVPELDALNGDLSFSERGVDTKNLRFMVFGSSAKLIANTDKKGKMRFNTTIENLDYTAASKFYLPFASNIIAGRSNTNVKFVIDGTGLSRLSATSDLLGVTVFAPSPLGKQASEISDLKVFLSRNDNILNLKYLYNDTLRGKVSFDRNGNLIVANTLLGGEEGDALDRADLAKVNIQANLPTVNLPEWLLFVSKLTSANSNTQEDEGIFPIAITLMTKDMRLDNMSLGDGTANLWVNKSHASFNFNFVRGDGYGGYDYALNKVVLSLNNLRLMDATKHVEKSIVAESGAITDTINNINTQLNWPLVDLTIKQLYYQNRLVGRLGLQLTTKNKDLFITNGSIINEDMDMNFDGASMCLLCGNSKQYSHLQFGINFKNLGNVINNLGNVRIMEQGRGDVVGSIGWSGGMEDFDINKVSGAVNVRLSSGKFLQVNTGIFGNLIGGLLGIINLQAITQITRLGFNDLFSSGFYFNDLDANVNLFSGKLEVMQFKMLGSSADVISDGQINLEKETINMWMQVIPKLGLTAAVTAGVVTLQPLVGIGTYLAEIILGEPVNKLFGLDLHLSGDLNKPQVDNVEITKQVYNNINSAIGKTN